MSKNFLTLFLVCSFIIAGCQSGDNSTNATTSKDSITTTDSAPMEKQSLQKELEDPDPTDTIPASAYGINTYGKQTVEIVKTKLREMFKDDLSKNLIPDESRKFILFEYDLNNDAKKEIFVGLTGSNFCGTGGCTILLLNNDGSVITEFSVTGYPIIVASSITKNWKDLIFYSDGKNHLMKFNGKTYPSNPSVQPAFKLIPGDELPRLLDFTKEPYPWFEF